MCKSLWFSGCSALFAASLLYIPPVHAANGQDGRLIVAQGVTGAPHAGPTGTGGGSGVGDHDAGTDITDSYDNPVKSTSSALDKTTSGHHGHHSRNSENNNMNPPGTYNGPAGTTRPNNPMPNSGSSGMDNNPGSGTGMPGGGTR